MEGLLLVVAEIMIVGISVWVVVTETKSPEEIRRLLDVVKPPKKPRFPEFAQGPVQPGAHPRRS